MKRNKSRSSAPLCLGLMSGTSMDGIDAVVARFRDSSDETVCHRFFPYSRELRRRLGELVDRPEAKLSEIGALDFALGRAFGKAAKLCWTEAKQRVRDPLLVIGSHGQTIFHEPSRGTSIQLGCPQAIAQVSGITTVSDFRRADICLGGEGAPMLPLYHKRLFGRGQAGLAVHNLGGISNFTYFGPRDRLIALDTGPANCLLDMAVEHFSNGKKKFDTGGKWAAKGKINQTLLRSWMDYPCILEYRRRPAPKSTGRELFTRDLLRDWLAHPTVRAVPQEDILATLSWFTVELAAEAYEQFVRGKRLPLRKIVFTGGGANNATLLAQFSQRLPAVEMTTVRKSGIDPQALEPQAFAFYGLLCILGLPQSLPAATGAKAAAVGGVITPGANWRMLYPKVNIMHRETFPI